MAENVETSEIHMVRLEVVLHRPVGEEEAERALEAAIDALGAGGDDRNEWDWFIDPLGGAHR
jgi:hypothetical protein